MSDVPRADLFDAKMEFFVCQGSVSVRIVRFSRLYADPPDWYIPSHAHRDCEFHYITNGRGLINIENNEFEVKGGQLYITGPFVQHNQRSDPGNPMEEDCLECEFDFLEEPKRETFLEEYRQLKRALSTVAFTSFEDGSALNECFSGIVKEVQQRRPGYNTKIQSLAETIIIEFFRCVGFGEGAVQRSDSYHINYSYIGELKAFLETNLSTDVSIKDASRFIYLSERQIDRLMKEEYGLTFYQYLTNLRLRTAVRLLQTTSAAVSKIAEQVGFTSYHHMYQVMKRNGYDTPSVIRTAIGEN